MPGGGRLVIECANHTVKRRVVDAHADVEPGEYVMIAVRDQGAGITDDVRPHLFEPFFTTKPAGRGTGLGLATCYGIVRQAGGHILVDSEPGRGAVFKVLLPRVAAVVESAPARTRSLPAGGAETVLFVEDDAMVRRVAVRVLGDAGYRVIAAVDGMDGLRRSMEHNGTIDLVVTDVVMPGLDGPELARRLRAARPDVKIVFTSGYADGALRLSEDAPVRFLPKPYVIESLLAYVRAALDA
jgi:two-component system, cell cycle sensor histidine kinase and response regulator CckA